MGSIGYDHSSRNKVIMSSVMVALFVPGLILLGVLIIKSLRRWKTRKLVLSILSLLFFLFLGRIVQASVFMTIERMTYWESVDAFVRYWIHYILLSLQFVVISLFLFLWDQVISMVGNKGFSKRTKFILSGISGVNLLAIIILLGTMKPMYDRDENILFVGIALVFILASTAILIPFYFVSWRKLRSSISAIKSTATRSFSNRVRVFSICLMVIFIIRMILEIVVLFIDTSEITLRIIEFLNNSLPELVITYCFIGLIWKGVWNFQTYETELSEKAEV